MKIGGLSLFSKTSDARTINMASWHSPHSLTWRWILSLRRHQFTWPKPFALRNSVGIGAGLGTLFSFHAYRTNGGLQWEVSVLWRGISFSQQRPMWYRDMYGRAEARWETAEKENRRLQREVDASRFAAIRASDPTTGSHLN